MVLVLLGTGQYSFERLLKEVEKCIEQNIIKDEVIVQAGHTKYDTTKMQILDIISIEELQKLILEADLIITHGGVGSITQALKSNKKIIAVPRLKKFGEVANDHQLQIVENFANKGYLKGVFEIEELSNVIKEIDNFTPNSFVSNTENIIKIIENYIKEQ